LDSRSHAAEQAGTLDDAARARFGLTKVGPEPSTGVGQDERLLHQGYRLGVDLGGTKIESLLLDPKGTELWRKRIPTPRGDYAGTLRVIAALCDEARSAHPRAARCSVGLGIPGSLGPDGKVRNANSVWLNGMPFAADLERALGQTVAMANDANCLALSEAADGAGRDAETVFAVILGTGVGGGLVVHRRLWQGTSGLAGEWGHVSLPWPRPNWGECPGPKCWCGRTGCIEGFLSGPGLARDAGRTDGDALQTLAAAYSRSPVEASAQGICDAGTQNAAGEAVDRYLDRLARSLAMVINIVDPEVIVLGGGMSQFRRIYQEVPERWDAWIFSDRKINTRLLPARHGDASGVRGAARLGVQDHR
jgi:predicted NBD/HSP70 family sugar kinase